MAWAGFERGDDALGPGQQLEPGDRLVVGGRVVLGPPGGGQRGVLRADARVVEAGAHRVGLEDLAVLVLEEQRPGAVQHPGDAAGHRRAVAARLEAQSPGLDADEPSRCVEEPGEGADGVRPAADAGHHDVGVGGEHGPTLVAGLLPDDPLELADHPRVRVGPDHRPDAVVGRFDARHPVAQRLVDRVLQRGAARLDRHHLGAEQPHAPHVEGLALHVDRTHEHQAVEPEEGRRGRGGDAVLAGAGLGDDPTFAHAAGEQRLAEHVVDLVRAGMGQVLALEQDAHPQPLRQAAALGDRRGTPRVGGEQLGELGTKRRRRPGRPERVLELLEGGGQRLGHEPAAELAEPAQPGRLRTGGWQRDPRRVPLRSRRDVRCDPSGRLPAFGADPPGPGRVRARAQSRGSSDQS